MSWLLIILRYLKNDMLPDETLREQTLKRIVDELQWKGPVFAISSIRSEGTQQLCYALMQLIDELKQVNVDD